MSTPFDVETIELSDSDEDINLPEEVVISSGTDQDPFDDMYGGSDSSDDEQEQKQEQEQEAILFPDGAQAEVDQDGLFESDDEDDEPLNHDEVFVQDMLVDMANNTIEEDEHNRMHEAAAMTTRALLDDVCNRLRVVVECLPHARTKTFDVLKCQADVQPLFDIAQKAIQTAQDMMVKENMLQGAKLMEDVIARITAQEQNWKHLNDEMKKALQLILQYVKARVCDVSALILAIKKMFSLKAKIMYHVESMSPDGQAKILSILDLPNTLEPALAVVSRMLEAQTSSIIQKGEPAEVEIQKMLDQFFQAQKFREITEAEAQEAVMRSRQRFLEQEEPMSLGAFIVDDDKAKQKAQKAAKREAAALKKAAQKAEKNMKTDMKTALGCLRRYAKQAKQAAKKADAQAEAAQKKAAREAAAQKKAAAKADAQAAKDAKLLAEAATMARDTTEFKLQKDHEKIMDRICKLEGEANKARKLANENKKLAVVEKALEIKAAEEPENCKKRDRRDRSQSQPTGLSPLQNKQRVDNATGDGAAGSGPRTCLFDYVATNDTTNVIVDPATQEELASLKKTLDACRKDLNMK